MTTRFFYRGIVPLAVTLLIVASLVRTGSGQANGGAVSIDNDDIGGVVTGARGPEAGVWVIAETRDLPTKMVKVVVTDDQGATCSPTCPRRTTTSGCAATASSIRRSRSRRPGRP